MAVHGGPDIVEDGLVFAVDAGNGQSYVSGSLDTFSLVSSVTGSLDNTLTFLQPPASSSCWAFDGADDEISMDLSSLNFGTGDFSYSLWIKSNMSSANRYFLGNTTAAYDNAGTIAFGVHTATYPSWRLWASGQNQDGSTTIVDGNWHNIALSRNSGTITVYVDGDVDGTPTSQNRSITNAGTVVLGKYSTIEYWLGEIANINIYNKALTSTEVLQNYNATKGRFI